MMRGATLRYRGVADAGGKTLESVADARGEDSRVCGCQGGRL